MPTVGSIWQTPEGRGVVSEVQLLKGLCKILPDSAPETPKLFKYTECTVIKAAPRQNGGAQDPDAEQSKEQNDERK